MVGNFGPTAVDEGAATRLEALKAELDIGFGTADHLQLLVDLFGNQRQQTLHRIRHVGTVEQVADVGAAVLFAQVHDLGPGHVDTALSEHVRLDSGIGNVLVLLRSR